MKYRKKPVVIEATQYFNKLREEDNLPEGVIIKYWVSKNQDLPTIETLEGDHIVGEGDYVITGIEGERYPCKPDIFEKTYEKV